MSRVAAEVRRNKEQHPDLYCLSARCLWKVVTTAGRKPCPKHPVRCFLKNAHEGPCLVALTTANAPVLLGDCLRIAR